MIVLVVGSTAPTTTGQVDVVATRFEYVGVGSAGLHAAFQRLARLSACT